MKASMTPESILKQLMEGRIVVYRFTVPEGLTVAETAALLEQRGVVDKDEFVAATATAESRLWPSNTSTEVPQRLEGYLFPDTYDYRPGINAPTVVAMMHDRFAQVWTQAMEVRALELGMSRHEVLTLASIIEEEAQVPSERPTISGVYHNRLRVGMKLDADPTVAYAVGKKPGEPLLLADLAQESPYNTYLVPGLPPGPIAAPGIASIEAALNPASHDYWFFVAKADGSGEHYFATTIEEQTQNIALAEANQGGN